MIFKESKFKGAYIIDIERIEDGRGFFARSWCQEEFQKNGLNSSIVQCNIAFNKNKGTLRGMHYQSHPYEEVKLIRCTKGAIYDVIIDLRPESKTFMNWMGVELTEKNGRMLYVPSRFAHGYQTLVDDTEVAYQVSQFYSPEHEKGVRWNDPVFSIKWPIENNMIISEKDKNWGDFIL